MSRKEFSKEWVIEAKENGNKLFREKKSKEAIVQYSNGLNAVNWPKEESDLRVQLLTNRAFCYLNVNEYELCIRDCNDALHLQPNNPKALFRRSQALQKIGKLQEAFTGLHVSFVRVS